MLLTHSRSRRPLGALRRGFTLLEILVVLAIIGLLVGLAVKNVDGIFGRSQASIAKIFVNDTIKSSIVQYRIATGDYPTTAEGLDALINPPASKADKWNGPYMDAKGGKVPLDPWEEAYVYRYPGTHNKRGYDIFSKGPDKVEGTEDDVGNW